MQKWIIVFVSLSIVLSILVSILISPPQDMLSGYNMSSIVASVKTLEIKKEKSVTISLKDKISFNNILIEPFEMTEDRVVALNVYSSDGEQILRKDIEEGTFFDIGNTRITLVKVKPYPISTKGSAEGDYRMDFIFEVIE